MSSPPPCEIGPYLTQLLEAAGDRIKVAGDVLTLADFFLADDQLKYDEKEFAKALGSPESLAAVNAFRLILATLEPFETTALEAALKDFATRQQLKIGQLVQPLRMALTGKSVGIGLYETMVILGRDRTLARIDASLSHAQNRQAT